LDPLTRLRIGILLCSSVAFKMPTKNKFICLLLTVATFTLHQSSNIFLILILVDGRIRNLASKSGSGDWGGLRILERHMKPCQKIRTSSIAESKETYVNEYAREEYKYIGTKAGKGSSTIEYDTKNKNYAGDALYQHWWARNRYRS
jgi:hypothetical protein